MNNTEINKSPESAPKLGVVDGSLLLAEAGVKIGDKVNWVPRFPIIGAGKRRVMTVKGIHIGTHELNRGQPAIHVVGENGDGFRAYPGEIVLANID
jgi:hypothetical protein